MKRTLIVATTSYAGMGPYVTEIVNTFDPTEDVFFFFHDYEDDFFKKNIKKELLNKSVFLKKANSAKNKLLELLTNCTPDDSTILRVCKKQQIELVHYINGIPTTRMQRNFAKLNITVLSTINGKNIVKMYRNGTQFYATFLKGDGSPLANTNVTFNINGVFYTKQTDKNGIAKLSFDTKNRDNITASIGNQKFTLDIFKIESSNLVKYYKND